MEKTQEQILLKPKSLKNNDLYSIIYPISEIYYSKVLSQNNRLLFESIKITMFTKLLSIFIRVLGKYSQGQFILTAENLYLSEELDENEHNRLSKILCFKLPFYYDPMNIFKAQECLSFLYNVTDYNIEPFLYFMYDSDTYMYIIFQKQKIEFKEFAEKIQKAEREENVKKIIFTDDSIILKNSHEGVSINFIATREDEVYRLVKEAVDIFYSKE